MEVELETIYNLCRSRKYADLEQFLKTKLSGRPETEVIEGEIKITINLKQEG